MTVHELPGFAELDRTCAGCGDELPYDAFDEDESGRVRRCFECARASRYQLPDGAALREIRTQQGNVCAICCLAPATPYGFAELQIDHDHRTDRVRGLLCGPCNLMLGHADDDPSRLQAAADYLKAAAAGRPYQSRTTIAQDLIEIRSRSDSPDAERQQFSGFTRQSSPITVGRVRYREWRRNYGNFNAFAPTSVIAITQ